MVLGGMVFLLGACTQYNMTRAERTIAYHEFIESEKLESKKRVSSFRMDGWTSLGDEHLIVRHRVSDYYLLTLTRTCYDLEHANGIVFDNTDQSLEPRFDWIATAEFPLRRCYIETIHKLTKDQRKAMFEIGKVQDEET